MAKSFAFSFHDPMLGALDVPSNVDAHVPPASFRALGKPARTELAFAFLRDCKPCLYFDGLVIACRPLFHIDTPTMSVQRLLQQHASLHCFSQHSYCRHITCLSVLRQQNLKASDLVANQRFWSQKQGLCKVAAEANVQQQEIGIEEQDPEKLDSQAEIESDDNFQEEEMTDPEPLVQPMVSSCRHQCSQ